MGKRGPRGPAGASAGLYGIKSCGKAHSWCRVCKPQSKTLATRAQSSFPPEERVKRPCHNCGRCDACLNLAVPEGMKVCRLCRQVKLLSAFSKRSLKEHADGRAGSGYRGQCKTCREKLEATRRGPSSETQVTCEVCERPFTTLRATARVCLPCRETESRACRECGKAFVGHTSRYFCSTECLSVATKRGLRERHATVRMEALRAYGGTPPHCVCCGETMMGFLAFDHINGGGNQHRKETGGGGFMSWLKRHNFPPGLQVLCHNCNYGRYLNGGICPHKARVEVI